MLDIVIRELITNGVISVEFVRLQHNLVEFVRLQHNLADHLMKGLAKDLVDKFALRMKLKSI